MEGLARLQASRRGYRAHVTKTFGRITEITDSTEPITPAQMISLRTALEQLQQKKVKLEEVRRYEDRRFYTGRYGIGRGDMRS